MSNDNLTVVLKSCSEGELINGEAITMTPNQTDCSRLRRTFTLPRNPFGNRRISLRRLRPDCDRNSNESSSCSNDTDCDGVESGRKLFRRPSWRKFMFKMSQHLNSVTSSVKESPLGDRVPYVPDQTDGLLNGEACEPWPQGMTPGVVGLRNHGNTCYMNAVMQCLSHTDALAKYFVLDHYKVDMLRRNKLNSKKYGTRGELTEQLAVLLKSLWRHQYKTDLSLAFKSAVERHGPVFRGSSQHDAQEFLFWLLDKVHEDLNTATKKKYKTIKNSCGRPDEIVAAETLANHTRRNSSFVQDVFQAQYRSALTCIGCHGTSCTFDPFHCVSVQLPLTPINSPTQTLSPMKLSLKMVYNNSQADNLDEKIEVEIPPSTSVTDSSESIYNTIRKAVISKTKLSSSSIVLASILDTGWRPFNADVLQTDSHPSLYCIEVATPSMATPSNPPADTVDSLDSITPYITVVWINCAVNGENRTVIGVPHSVRVAREANYEDLIKLLLKHNGVTPEKCNSTPRLKLLQPHLTNYYVQSELPHPLYAEEVESALVSGSEDAEGPIHIKLELEWEKSELEKPAVEEKETEAESSSPPVAPGVTLDSCLVAYTLPERLEAGCWRCPSCRRSRPAHKTLGLWSLPTVLLIHLKRFSQQQMRGRKLTTAVHFPLRGLDMSTHVRRGANQSAHSSTNLNSHAGEPSPRNALYDLYAVCYHHGTDVGAGHYTACCLSSADGRWYKYDDAHVTTVSPDNLVHPSAYMLFYKKRTTEEPMNPHWSWRLAPPMAHKVQPPLKAEVKEGKVEVEVSVEVVKEESPVSESPIRQSPILESPKLAIAKETTLIDSDIPFPIAIESALRSVSYPSPLQCSLSILSEPETFKIDKLPTPSLPIHKDVHINPKMTCATVSDEAVSLRVKSENIRHASVNSFVSSINGLEYEERPLDEESAFLTMMLCSQSPPRNIANITQKICVD